ncbi:hypothetical protein [Ruminococcus albus]|nr:hypothetical protein [Ruminococcus albus]
MIYRRAVLSVSTALFGGNNFGGGKGSAREKEDGFVRMIPIVV